MLKFFIKRKVCKNGGIGRWFAVQGKTTVVGVWLSFGPPYWLLPRLIWQEMKVDPDLNTPFDLGVGWLFFCVRFTIQRMNQPRSSR